MVVVLSLGMVITTPVKSPAQGQSPPKLFDAVKEDVNSQPASKDNLQARHHVLRTLSGILLK